MLATDQLVAQHFPQYLPSEEELQATGEILAKKPDVQELVQKFVCIGGNTQATLRRFCWQAKQNDFEGAACAQEALRLLELCLAQRLALGLDSILELPSFPNEYWKSFISTVPQTYHGLGQRGQPILLIRAGAIQAAGMDALLRDGEDFAVAGINAAVLCFLRCEEFLLRKQIPLESSKVGHLTDRIVLIIDLWGLGPSHWRFLKDFLAVAVKQLVLLYPETLDRLVVANAAWAFARLLWPLLKQLMHPVTQRKTQILDAGNTREKLLEYMDDSVIPECLGGKSPGVHLGEMLNTNSGNAGYPQT